ncbi:hypothetical protein L6Q79_10010 [bacterium]|nr:hypothetical protein [bacterium]NUN47032.1 hypothetical protein [bacterium]
MTSVATKIKFGLYLLIFPSFGINSQTKTSCGTQPLEVRCEKNQVPVCRRNYAECYTPKGITKEQKCADLLSHVTEKAITTENLSEYWKLIEDGEYGTGDNKVSFVIPDDWKTIVGNSQTTDGKAQDKQQDILKKTLDELDGKIKNLENDGSIQAVVSQMNANDKTEYNKKIQAMRDAILEARNNLNQGSAKEKITKQQKELENLKIWIDGKRP